MIEAGSEPIAGYRLVSKLGEGGFGEVWKAEAPGGLQVAIKFIRTQDGHADVELRALQTIAKIRHPNLLDLHLAKQMDDRLVIVSSLCDCSLMDRLRECREEGKPGIPRKELLGYMESTALALDFLNSRKHPDDAGALVGVQHRDIKPHNIFLVGGAVKVADFGLAKALENSVASHTGSMTVVYAPPEMFSGKISSRSDQYSLAVTYYQLRTGRLPFSGTRQQVIHSIVMGEPQLGRLHEDEQAVVRRALSRSPKDRFPTCREFVRSLSALATTRSIPSKKSNRVATQANIETAPMRDSTLQSTKPLPRSIVRRLASTALIAAMLAGIASVGFWYIRSIFEAPVGAVVSVAQAELADDSGNVTEPAVLDAPDEPSRVAKAAPQSALENPAEPVSLPPVEPVETVPRLIDPFEFPFATLRPGAVPKDLADVVGNIAVDHRNGIPCLRVTGTGAELNRIRFDDLWLAGDFFLEMNLTGSIDLRFVAASGNDVDIRVMADQYSEWTAVGPKGRFPQLSPLGVMAQQLMPAWVRLQNEDGNLSVLVNGGSPTVVADATDRPFEALELTMAPPSNIGFTELRNLAWGPILPVADLPTKRLDGGQTVDEGLPSSGWTQIGNDGPDGHRRFTARGLEIGRSFELKFDITPGIRHGQLCLTLLGSDGGANFPLRLRSMSGYIHFDLAGATQTIDGPTGNSPAALQVRLIRDGDVFRLAVAAQEQVAVVNSSLFGNFEGLQIDALSPRESMEISGFPTVR